MLRRHYFALAFLPVVFACTSGADSEETDVGTDSDTEEDFDTGVTGPDRRDTDGTCTPQAGTCEVVEVRELLVVASDYYLPDEQDFGLFTSTITTQMDWEAWWVENAPNAPASDVDFESETVLIAGYGINATCEARLADYTVTDCDGTLRLTATTEDITGTCYTTCDALGGAIVAVAVPNSNTEVCAQVDLSCATARR